MIIRIARCCVGVPSLRFMVLLMPSPAQVSLGKPATTAVLSAGWVVKLVLMGIGSNSFSFLLALAGNGKHRHFGFCKPRNETSMWLQREFSLAVKRRGFHLVTSEVLAQVPEIASVKMGLFHLFLQHTSASLTINENADPDVRTDMETYLNSLAPEHGLPLRHTLEGPDDMPAHVKSSLLGASITLPIRGGQLALGTWQGIYLCEHRNQAGPRRLMATLHGD